jgi:tetratricopeptide (TPR) repeat protein
LILLKDDPQSLRQFVLRLTESRDALANSNARSNVRALLAEQLASQPKNAAALLELSGDLFAADRDWERAIAAYVKGLASEPANVAVLSKLASAYQSVGRTREAIVPLGASSSLNPTDTILTLKIAALQAWFGQESEFAATRRQILNFAQGTTDAVTAERIAKASSLLLSSDKAELETAVGLARKAVEVGHSSGLLPYFQLALGMAEYRNAHFVEADAALVAAVNGAKDNRIIAGTSAFYRAMCLFRQGKSDEARKLATEAAATMRPLPADEKNPLAGSVSHDDLILWLAYKEAKALLELNSKTP